MPRFMVHRTFPEGLVVPMSAEGESACGLIVEQNMAERVTWIQSFVATDKSTTFCVYDGPSSDAVRRAAERTGLPIDHITEVRILDPYFYF